MQFQVNPTAGVIPGGKQVEVEVTFRPGSKTKAEETLTMKVNGGPDKTLAVSGEIPEAKLSVLTKKVIGIWIGYE